MKTTKVKICGITRLEDALLAERLGAFAVGFVFHRASPRYVTLAQAKAIIERLSPRTQKVGVFVDASVEDIQRAHDEAGITLAQLHGEESPAFAAGIARPYIKAVRARSAAEVSPLSQFTGASFFLIDAFTPDAHGGTGKRSDWSLASLAKSYGPVLLAGGLNPKNVCAALEAVRPQGIDLSSGVESAPGRKDPTKMVQLFEAIALSGIGVRDE